MARIGDRTLAGTGVGDTLLVDAYTKPNITFSLLGPECRKQLKYMNSQSSGKLAHLKYNMGRSSKDRKIRIAERDPAVSQPRAHVTLTSRPSLPQVGAGLSFHSRRLWFPQMAMTVSPTPHSPR